MTKELAKELTGLFLVWLAGICIGIGLGPMLGHKVPESLSRNGNINDVVIRAVEPATIKAALDYQDPKWKIGIGSDSNGELIPIKETYYNLGITTKP